MACFAATLAAIWFAASGGHRAVAAFAAAAFAASIIAVGWRTDAKRRTSERSQLLRLTVRLSSVICSWAAGALFLAYPIAGLRWQHGWQYGFGAAVFAIGFALYSGWLSRSDPLNTTSRAVVAAGLLAEIEATAIAIILAWLMFSGKLMTTREDWLANDVFLATGAVLLFLSLQFALTARTTSD